MSLHLPTYRTDCLHFRGDIPCVPHKQHGIHCAECEHYSQQTGSILIIKLGAIGDVIRTTPLLHKLRKEYPTKSIVWLTYSPDVLPDVVHRPLMFSTESIVTLQATRFDLLINLDKDPHACALASTIQADEKMGFILEDGKPAPVNANAEHKFLTGLFDDVNKANTKSYVEEIFEICGWIFSGEEYMIATPAVNNFHSLRNGQLVVGLNTGCGERWTSRRWSDAQWEELIALLKQNGYSPLLLGGKQEHALNTTLAHATGAQYHGYFPLQEFIAQVDSCDCVVTAVTMGFHIAVGLHKPVVLMNNIFNPNEFELYGRGEIVQPEKQCHCFFRGTCINKEYQCMDSLYPHAIFTAVERSLTHKKQMQE